MKKMIILLILILLLCGCKNKKCIKSHEEEAKCPRTVCIPINRGIICITAGYYDCKKTVCDKYED